MVDIYGRSLTRRKRDKVGITKKEVSEITSAMLSSLLTLKEADHNEIVVFDNNKKLVTSNISANDILSVTKYKTALEDFFVPEKNEFDIPGSKPVKKEKIQLAHLDAVVNNVKVIRENINKLVESFFGDTFNDLTRKRNPVPLKLTLDTIKKSIDTINTKLPVDNILSLEDINPIKTSLDDIKLVTSKIKTANHTAEQISNIVYTVKTGSFDWIKTTNERLNFELPSVKGFYRITIFHDNLFNTSDIPFSISGRTSTTMDNGIVGTIIRGLNDTAMFRITDSATKNTTVSLTISHPDTVRESLCIQ